VLSAVALLVALPGVVAAWPTRTPTVDAGVFRDRILASAGVAHQGYAVSVGALGLPPLPQLGQVASLLSSTTQMRTWYGARDRWRVDVIDTGSERGFYQTPDGQYTWDFAANQLTHIAPPVPRFVVLDGAGEFQVSGGTVEPPVRLPRAADLLPPDLARRLLAAAAGDRVESIPGRRVAGIAAAGLRIVPADPHSTVGHIDIWADPRTGLPLQVEASARGAERPVLVTRFLEVGMTAPGAGVLTPPTAREEVSVTVARVSQGIDELLPRAGTASLPDRLAGLPRQRAAVDEVEGPDLVGVYGTGLTRIAVLPLSRRIGPDVYKRIAAWGQTFSVPAGNGAMISTSLLSVLVVQADRRTYLAAGMVDAEFLRQVGVELAGGRG